MTSFLTASMLYVGGLGIGGQMLVIVILSFALFGLLQFPITVGGLARRIKRRIRLYNRLARR